MKIFEYLKKNRLIIAPKNKILYRANYKLTKLQRREFRRFMRANGIFGAVITDVKVPKEIEQIMNMPTLYSYEWNKFYRNGKVRQV